MSEKPEKGQTKVEPCEVNRENAVHIFPKWCKGCGICVAFCPKQVLTMGEDQKAHVTYPEKCIKCGLCARRCPEFAVYVSDDDLKDSNKKNGGEK